MAIKKILVAGILSGITSVANAGLITEWNYLNEAGFVAQTPGSVVASELVLAGSSILSQDNWKKLTWGDAITSAGKSSLSIDSPVTGTIDTVGQGEGLVDSDFGIGTTLTHNNYRIGGGGWLTGATLLDGLKLSASAWDVPFDLSSVEGIAPELEIQFSFIETSNRPNGGGTLGGVCADGSVAGTDIDDLNPAEDFGCDDYFILHPIDGVDITVEDQGDADASNDYLQFSVIFDLLEQGFPEALADSLELQTQYRVTTRLFGLGVAVGYCPGFDANCVGFKTKELESNQLFASFAVQAVPEPSTLAILGLALVGMGFSRKKMSK